jgi:alpha-1,2-mannosyltransferase
VARKDPSRRGITRVLSPVAFLASPRQPRPAPQAEADAAAWRLPGPPVCAALYAASAGALLLSHLGHGWGFVDLAIYRDGGEAALHGEHLYALRFPGALAFTYPPFAALLFTALTAAPMASLRALATTGNMLLLPAMLGFALRLAPVSSWLRRRDALSLALLASAGAIWLEPVWSALRYGQLDLLLGALVLYDLSRPDASRWKGTWIGLAMGLKLTPAIFALYLLASRRVRAAAVAVSVFAATVALGFATLPGDSREYWSGAFVDSTRVGRIENTANQSLRGALARVLHSMHVQLPWLCLAAGVGIAGMAMAVAAARRGDEARGFAACAVTGLLVSPVSWSHHWTLAVPALLLLAVCAARSGSAAVLAGSLAVALVAWAHVIWWVPVNRPLHSELRLDPVQLVYADAYVLAAVAALALAGWTSLGSWRASQRRPRPRLELIGASRNEGAL